MGEAQGLLRLQLPSPPRLSQGWVGARRVATFPGPARAASTFLTSGVRQGWAQPGVPGPAWGPRPPEPAQLHSLVRNMSGLHLEWVWELLAL